MYIGFFKSKDEKPGLDQKTYLIIENLDRKRKSND